MRVALIPLAFGAFTTWLLVGPLSKASALSLPFHEIHAMSTLEFALEILKAPSTWIAVSIVALGLLIYLFRSKLSWLSNRLTWLRIAAQNSFGFEKINQFIVAVTQRSASLLRKTQTGQLNWNLAALVSCLVIILMIVIWSI
jgi:NADH-quinone oxidoreductase subunit L